MAARRAKRLTRMTASWVPTAGEGDHTDPATPGLQLRVREKASGASRSWCFRYKWRGDPVRIVIGHAETMSLADARVESQRLRRALDDGIDPRRARPRRRHAPAALPASAAVVGGDVRHTVDFLASEFMTRFVRPRRKRPEYAEAIINRDVLPIWRGRDARTIEAAEVIELLDGIVDRGARVSANRTAALLGQMFKFGIHRRIVASSPVQLLFRPGGTEKPRERTLTEDELQTFLKDPQGATRFQRLSHAILVLLLTMQRRGELALARWVEIDFPAKTWTIPDENAKGGRGHIVPLSDWAVREFEALKRLAKGSPWVLPDGDGDGHLNPKQLTRSLAKCQKRFKERKINHFTLHDLRRTGRTGLSRLKIPTHIAERVLNHAQEGIVGVYDKWEYMDEKREALEKWAAHLEALA